MEVIHTFNSKKLIDSLKKGEVAVIPTDTIYGIVGLASSKKAVSKIYDLKGRNENKPFIILISSIKDLASLKIKLDKNSKEIIKKYWPGKVSIIFKRRRDAQAVRLPNYPELTRLIKKTGPLVAPSANPESLPPAKNLEEAIAYFGGKVTHYIDGGVLSSFPSTLIKLEDRKVVVLRKGAVTIDESDKAS